METQYKTGCSFCPPRSEFAIVGENDRAVAIVCLTAKSWGHSLIIPKDHSSNLFSAGMNETIWKEGIIPLMRDFINKLKKNPQVIGFFINSNAGGAAEQTVFHTHIHIVPVYLKDKDKWIAFFNGSTSEDSKLFPGPWENLYPDMMVHIDACLGKTLKKDGEGVIESFNLVARIGDGELGSGEHFWVIPKPSSYHWMGGSNSKHYNFQQREKIAEKINKGQWEEENAEEPNIPKKDKPTEEPIITNCEINFCF
ncbi:Putative HIT-like protein protein [endosymbiont DhMRE of Dentiscutata heterogama]|uniref:HIT family protein n=1 Tax=endosymbiont DhMRE of Dentiscutata heterogama TaxID=1609546 RepID=UPI000629DC26|nr:HIT family protein [endosymbiont DhMRE of Dentiscutata heterogama]CFW92790.1 Putative HIT-like protein protein [endosymbiont DhMRE of Dentiscutata heterogama]